VVSNVSGNDQIIAASTLDNQPSFW
jgi:hypothetical protein